MSDPNQTTDTTPKRGSKWPLLAVVVFGLLLLLPLCTFQVRQEEVALRTTFGSYSDKPITQPGLYWKLPWPVQKILTFDQRLRVFSTRYTDNMTRDDKALVLTLFAVWRIEDPLKFNESVGSTDKAQRVLADRISTVKNEVIGQHPVSHLVSTDPEALQFEAIEQEIQSRVAGQVKQEYGIELVMLGIERIGLPEAITQAVFQRMITERDNKAKIYRLEGERKAAERKAEADQAKAALLAKANAEAKVTRAAGDNASAEVFKDFKDDPEFALFLRKLEALEQAMSSKKTTLLIDRTVPPFDLLSPQSVPTEKPAPPPLK